jgi:hypothetical protein
MAIMLRAQLKNKASGTALRGRTAKVLHSKRRLQAKFAVSYPSAKR